MYSLLALATIFIFSGIILSRIFIERNSRRGKNISELKDEMEITKSVFSIIGSISIVTALFYGFSEFKIKLRSEDRQLFYSSIAQISGSGSRPDLSTAALLQLKRLTEHSREERVTLLSIISAYLNQAASKPVNYHDERRMTRPDIQISLEIISSILGKSPDLGKRVTLKDVDLRYINLESANLSGISILGSDISQSIIKKTNLGGCDLSGTNISDSSLEGTSFRACVLASASFSGSDLSSTNFCDVKAAFGVNFSAARNLGKSKCVPIP